VTFGHKMHTKIMHELARSVSISAKKINVMASEGAYRNAEFIKCVIVTRPY
jgi:hypothetical protein